VRGDPIRFQV